MENYHLQNNMKCTHKNCYRKQVKRKKVCFNTQVDGKEEKLNRQQTKPVFFMFVSAHHNILYLNKKNYFMRKDSVCRRGTKY